MRRLKSKLTYANVMATIAVFIALGGASYAAVKLPKNSVGAKQLKKNSIPTAKIKNEAITAAKVKKGTLTGTQINVSTLGTVPSAQTANSATVASSLPPAEPWHEVGAPGEPDFISGWKNVDDPAVVTAAFYKDQLGIVHLRGLVTAPSDAQASIFKLPPGFRPQGGKDLAFLGFCSAATGCNSNVGRIEVEGSDYSPAPTISGDVLGPPGNSFLSLSQVAFRAES